MAQKTVLIVGATGDTGGSIVNALLESPQKFKVTALIRTSSAEKEEVKNLRSRGVAIQLFDLDSGDVDSLVQVLQVVDIVISTIYALYLDQQKLLIDASKKANVSRFIPSDFGPACMPGIRKSYDQKLAIHEYIEKAGLGYTYIDVGGWSEQILPPLKRESTIKIHEFLWDWLHCKFGSEDNKTAITELSDIGKFVAHIILDHRTLNHYVFCWAEEVTQQEVFDLAESVVGEKIPITEVSETKLLDAIKEGEKEGSLLSLGLEYMYSIWIRGDNTLSNALKPEYGSALDARALYPELQPKKLKDVARELYRR